MKDEKNVICATFDRIGNRMISKGSADMRFSSLSEEDLDKILLTASAENTIHPTKTWVAVFLLYLEEKSVVTDLNTCQASKLADVLKHFTSRSKNKRSNHGHGHG